METKIRLFFGDYENPSDELLELRRKIDSALSMAREVASRRRGRETRKMALEIFQTFSR